MTDRTTHRSAERTADRTTDSPADALLRELLRHAVPSPREPDPAVAHDPDTRRHAALLVADTLGVALAGGRRPEARALVVGDELTGSWRLSEPGPGPSARLLTAGGGFAPPDRAAYVNATAACALEMDEGTRPTGHPAVHVLPAALAAGEVLNVRWSRLLTAFIAGYEVAAGLFAHLALRPPTHPHGHLGAAGAATAVAVLAGDDPLPVARAALTVPLLSTWPPALEGANVRNTWAGHATAAGLLARRLVRAGYRGSASALGAAFDGLVADRVETADPPPGGRLTGGYLKLYSACALTHGAIEAALRLGPLETDAVESVRVEVNRNSLRTAPQPVDNDLSRRFSIPYVVAVALLRQDAAPERFDVPDPAASALARRVSVEEDEEFTAAWPRYAPARVTVRLRDGRTTSAEVRDARGHPGSPVGPDAVAAKFHTLTGLPPTVWELLTSGYGDRTVREVLDAVVGRTPPTAS